MKEEHESYIRYRMERAWDTLDDAKILASKGKWNSTVNRLYYSVYYAVMALLLKKGLKPATHNGAKSNFTQYFIKNQLIDKQFGTLYSQLFTWRLKGDYNDLYDFEESKVKPFFEPVEELIKIIETLINQEDTRE